MRTLPFLLILLGVLITACHSNSNKVNNKKSNGYDVTLLNDSIEPCENFFGYTASKWIKENPIPETESRWGSFNILIEENNKRLKTILSNLSSGTFKNGTPEQMIKDLYEAAMDSAALTEKRITPLKKELASIEAISSKSDFVSAIAQQHINGVSPLFAFYGSTDQRNSSINAAKIWQTGIGLPDREYYFRDKPKSIKIREAYKAYMGKLFQLAELDNQNNIVDRVYAIEEKLAKSSNTRTENRNSEKTYNKLSKEEVQRVLYSFDLNQYYKEIGAPSFDSIIVAQPGFLAGVQNLLNEVPMEDWKLYLKWNLLRSFATHLGNDFEIASFEFYGKTLKGKSKMSERWKRSLGIVNSNVGELLGQIYVKEYFQEEMKAKLNLMVENLRQAYKERIHELDWMSPETKERALLKIKTFTKKIGYPDKWKSYEGLVIQEGKHLENIKAINTFLHYENMAEIGKPVDKTKWHMPPQTVNAYYDPTVNEVVFPAGILQAPFFTPDADDAVNYGAIGVVIGHEFTHGFDDQGSKYDEKGNLNDWWTKVDRTKFETRTKVLRDQFNEMSPLEGYNVNGDLTLGENIADLGGIIMAYNALIKSYEGKSLPANIDGFNYKQRFFLGYARLWRSAIRDEALIQRLETDPHSPAEARVNGPLKNLKIFQEAWGCQNENSMVIPEDEKAKIW